MLDCRLQTKGDIVQEYEVENILFILCWDFSITKKSEGQEDNQEGTNSAVLKTRPFNSSSFNMKLLTSSKPYIDIRLR